jgi:hypothetical protein
MRRCVTGTRAKIDRRAGTCHLVAMIAARARNSFLSAAWIRVLLIAAVVLSAFAHRPLLDEPQPLELAQYVLPDGTLPDLCLTQERDGDPRHHHHHAFCDFCVIAGASAPAQPVAVALSQPLQFVLAVIKPQMTAPPVATIDLATASLRGPPAVSA